MTRDQAGERLHQIGVEDYLKRITKKQGKMYVCPFCGSGTGSNRTGAGSVDNRTKKYSCFSCHRLEMDLVDLIQEHEHIDKAAAFERAYSLYNIDIDGSTRSTAAQDFNLVIDYQEEPERKGQNVEKIRADIEAAHENIAKHPEALEYLKGRGLTPETIERFKLGYDSTRKQVIIPYGPETPYYIGRSILKDIAAKNKHNKPTTEEAGEEPVFNGGSLYNTQGAPVFIVEAPLCAISIVQAGGRAVAIGGTGHNKLIKLLQRNKINVPLILSLDNDEPGEAAAGKLIPELEKMGVKVYPFNIAGEHKDPNEALQAEPEQFAASVQEAMSRIQLLQKAEEEAAKEEYRQTSAASHLEAFINGIQESVNTPFISTGFDNLDKPLDGGLYEGLYIIGAISSLGKTTFTMQIGDQIAKAGHDVVIFSLEMARTELMAKSISRETLINLEQGEHLDAAKSTREITTGKKWEWYNEKQKQGIFKAMKEYGEYAGRIWIHEGIGDIGAAQIRETIEKHINLLGKKPVVIIDYLQILEPYDMKATDKQNTDKTVLELKRITRDYKLPIMAISSFNRDNYKAPVNMASFKESGAIEYSSDVLIGLQLAGIEENGKPVKDFNVDEAKAKEPREVELKILKNRNGRTGDTMAFDYYPKYNYFMERY